MCDVVYCDKCVIYRLQPGDVIGFHLENYQVLCSDLGYDSQYGDSLYTDSADSPVTGQTLIFPDSYLGSSEAPYQAIIETPGKTQMTCD